MQLSFQSAVRSIDETAARMAASVVHWLVWPGLIGLAGGVTAWGARHTEQLSAISSNKLGEMQRAEMLRYVGGGVLGLFGLYLAVAVAGRLVRKRWHTARLFSVANRLLSFVMAGPLLLALMTPKIESSHEGVTLLLSALAALACVPTMLALLPREAAISADGEPSPWRAPLRKVGRVAAPLVLVGIWLAYAYFFSRLSITNHYGLNTRSIDLGIYDNIFYQSIHGNPLGCSFTKGGNHASAHFDPILVVLSPLYLLYPRAEMLLVLQATWAGAGVIPVYLLARAKTGSAGVGLVMAAVYALHPALHGATMYEFHSLTLLGTPLLFAIYFLEKGATWKYFAMLPVVLLIREDVSLVMCLVGGYALLTRRAAAVRMGWITIVISAISFVVVKRYFMPSSDILNSGPDSLSFAYYYRELIPPGTGFTGMVTSLLTNPVFALKIAVKEAKLIYLATMMLPLAFLSLWARPARVLLLYGVIFTTLATRSAVFSIHFQYIMLLLPALAATAPMGLRRLEEGTLLRRLGWSRRGFRVAVGTVMLVAGALTSWKFGAILENSSFRGGFTKITRRLSEKERLEYERLRELVDKLPPHASVTVTDKVGPHVSNRKDVYLYRHKHRTDYVLVDERELHKGLRGWHNRRKQRGELKQLAGHGTYKLFRVIHNPRSRASSRGRNRRGDPSSKGKTRRGQPSTRRPDAPKAPPAVAPREGRTEDSVRSGPPAGHRPSVPPAPPRPAAK